MWGVILKILSVIGIILLILLGLFLAAVLLLLFFPVTYRIRGEAAPDGEKHLTAKINWLFGLLRVRYAYPEPGKLKVKLLWKTVFETGKEDADTEENTEASPSKATVQDKAEQDKAEQTEVGPNNAASAEAESTEIKQPQMEAVRTRPNGILSRFSKKIRKIKYTILKIYDKIKQIWANISYYTELLQEDNTAKLWEHTKLRLGNVLKNIRPRHIRAEILFGTDSPDTTGYALGVYGMLSPFLGSKVSVTPDFTQAILEGYMDISGHITGAVLIWNALKLLLDKKLHLFIKKMKAGRKEVNHGR